MIDRQAAADPDRFEVRATADSHFAWIRTRLSLETALMAWARTAAALIGFGFAIVQFSEGFDALEHIPLALQPQAARYLGLALIAVGVLGLLVSILQYRYLTRYLAAQICPDCRCAGIAGVDPAPGDRDRPDADRAVRFRRRALTARLTQHPSQNDATMEKANEPLGEERKSSAG